MEIWGQCPTCDRWFYCPVVRSDQDAAWRCPVCGADPIAVEHRPST